MKSNIDDAKLILNRAFKYHSDGNTELAAKYYKQFIDNGFQDPRVYSNYAVILSDNLKVEEAILFYQKSINLFPCHQDAYSNLANLFLKQRKFNEAKSLLIKSIELDPNRFEPHLNLGITLRKLGELESSSSHLRKAYEINPNQPSICNEYGLTLFDLNQWIEAEDFFLRSIELNPNSSSPYTNLGLLFFKSSKFHKAESFLKKALTLKKDCFISCNILGCMYIDFGYIEKAENLIRKSIEINKYYAKSHLSLGNLFIQQGKFIEAEVSLNKAIKLDPSDANNFASLSLIYEANQNLSKAEFCLQKALELNSNSAYINSLFIKLLTHNRQFDKALNFFLVRINSDPRDLNTRDELMKLIANNDPTSFTYQYLKTALSFLLDFDDLDQYTLFQPFNHLFSNEKNFDFDLLESLLFTEKPGQCIFNNTLFLNGLRKLLFCDAKWEIILLRLRKELIRKVASEDYVLNDYQLNFFIALGEQCFFNEYVFYVDDIEYVYLDQIFEDCNKFCLTETRLIVLACYVPVYKFINKVLKFNEFSSNNVYLNKLLEVQLKEPLDEQIISKTIKRFGSISNIVSMKVKEQYEKNPYPRWKSFSNNNRGLNTFCNVLNADIKPNFVRPNNYKSPKILIAGCGTGKQIIHAKRYNGAEITAIDLSISSLAYAQRKVKEFNITNVQLLQMDILDISNLSKEFDVIECSGVLHHMQNPLQGLESLLSVLSLEGYLKIGLYSELARKFVVKARDHIKVNNILCNDSDIRSFRRDVINGDFSELSELKSRIDFFSLSMCRDLCFHSNEFRYSISQLKDIFNTYNLNFHGFSYNKQRSELYKNNFPDDIYQLDLNNWAKLEIQHPDMFFGMYQFWVSKNINQNQ